MMINQHMVRSPLGLAISCVAALAACPAAKSTSRATPTSPARPSDRCPAEAPAPPALPFSRPEHTLVEFWLARDEQTDRVLLDSATLEAHNERVRSLRDADGWPIGRWDVLARPVDRRAIRARWASSIRWLKRRVSEGKRFLEDGSQPSATLIEQLGKTTASATSADEIRVVQRGTPLRCYPSQIGMFGGRDRHELAFDLMQCAQLRFGEAVRVLAKTDDHWFVWSSYAHGWVDPSVLSTPLEPDDARTYIRPARSAIVGVDRLAIWAHPIGERLLGVGGLGLAIPLLSPPGKRPLRLGLHLDSGRVDGWIRHAEATDVDGYRPVTRSDLLRRAFALLNTPYGWGGTGDTRDCSRMLMDLFESFGVLIPRNSRHQSRAGVERIDVSSLGDAAKAAAIGRAARRGVVLLYLPGHIMLYVGRDGRHDYALHLFSGYLKPCRGGGETMLRANRTAVTSLELGRGSSRRAFIERITRLVLFAPETPTTGRPKPR